jgi:hypothetical protein
MISKEERKLTWINVLSRMRDGDDLQFFTAGGIVSIKYTRGSQFQAGVWEYREHRTSDIDEVINFLTKMNE